MSIIRPHIQFYKEIFQIDGFWNEPFLMIGLPEIEGLHLPKDFRFKNFQRFVKNRKLKKVYSLDLFDPEADFKLDLNKPVTEKYHGKFNVVADFGTIEHIFDTKQCLENYFKMLRKRGLLVISTSVNGYFGHGIHVFNPLSLKDALRLNGFSLLYFEYSSSTGVKVKDPSINKNIIVWIVARKNRNLNKFIVPQQKCWKTEYRKPFLSKSKKTSFQAEVFYVIREVKRYLVNKIPINIRDRLYGRI